MNKQPSKKQTIPTSRPEVPSSRTAVEDAIAAAKKHDSVWIENRQSEDWTQKKIERD